MIDGILAVDKPQGWTSHDVVARVRRVAGQRQVGHAGTLDPLATGVLVVVLGRATRFSSYLMESPKLYLAEVVLGAATTTDDGEGELLAVAHASTLNLDQIQRAVSSFQGEIAQIPPLYAAVRHGGEKLYVLARKGKTVTPEPRRVTILDIAIHWWRPPRLRLLVHCGSGTYIRALARDLGTALGVGGYLHALRRLASGSLAVGATVALEGLDRDLLLRSLHPPDRAVIHLPAASLDDDGERRFLTGRPVLLGGRGDGTVRLYGPSGGFLGLGRLSDGAVQPVRVFSQEPEPRASR